MNYEIRNIMASQARNAPYVIQIAMDRSNGIDVIFDSQDRNAEEFRAVFNLFENALGVIQTSLDSEFVADDSNAAKVYIDRERLTEKTTYITNIPLCGFDLYYILKKLSKSLAITLGLKEINPEIGENLGEVAEDLILAIKALENVNKEIDK